MVLGFIPAHESELMEGRRIHPKQRMVAVNRKKEVRISINEIYDLLNLLDNVCGRPITITRNLITIDKNPEIQREEPEIINPKGEKQWH